MRNRGSGTCSLLAISWTDAFGFFLKVENFVLPETYNNHIKYNYFLLQGHFVSTFWASHLLSIFQIYRRIFFSKIHWNVFSLFSSTQHRTSRHDQQYLFRGFIYELAKEIYLELVWSNYWHNEYLYWFKE